MNQICCIVIAEEVKEKTVQLLHLLHNVLKIGKMKKVYQSVTDLKSKRSNCV